MKERRGSERHDWHSHEDPESEEQALRESLRRRRILPGKTTALDEPGWLAGEAPARRTRFELEVARTTRPPVMAPGEALHYARWLLAPDRGWSAPEGSWPAQVDEARAQTDEAVWAMPAPHDELAVRRGPRARPVVAPEGRLAARELPGRHAGLGDEQSEAMLEEVLALLRNAGSGAPLPEAVATRMQSELGHPFAHVRIHTDAIAAEACAQLGAQAFTLGAHIYFGAGQFAPGSDDGDGLLRHELTHVLQHARGELAAHGRAELVSPSSAVEVEARAAEAPRPRPQRAMPDWAGAAPKREVPPGPTHHNAASITQPTAEGPTSSLALRAPAAPPATGGAKPPVAALGTVVTLTGDFTPSADIAAHLAKAGEAGAGVKVRLPGVTQTAIIQVKKAGARYVTIEDKPQIVPLSHPLFVRAGALAPVLRVRIGEGGASAITGYLTIGAATGDHNALQKALHTDLSALGLAGFTIPKLSLTNSLSNGVLTFGTGAEMGFSLGGWVNGQLSLGLNNDKLSFEAKAAIHARGLKDAEITFNRDSKGNIGGSAALSVALGENFTGDVRAVYQNGDINVRGELGYHSEKLSGKVGVILADAEQAEAMVRSELPPESLMPAGGGGEKPATAGKGKRGIAGHGTLNFAFTDWLTGAAKVVYGPSGHLTVIGKIAPPKQIDLMKNPKGINQPILPEVRIEASYGLPYIADVHVGIGVGLNASAGLGPIYMTDLALDGIYSTDPKVLNKFSITGTLRAQADAGLTLSVKGYAGLRVLGHSVNFGAEVLGKAGIKAYAEARTTLGYREKAAPSAGKKGEYYLQGHLEMAAQPVLSLGGNLFIELDSPWWSPAPDKTWRWPLGSLEYPLPTQLGIGADIDYVVGSGQWPEVKLSKPSFNAGKFVDSMMSSNLPPRSGKAGKQDKQGTWSGQAPAKPTATPAPIKPKAKAEPEITAGSAKGKPGKGNQTAAEKKVVPANPEVAKRWNAGMEALGELRKRSEKDPETKEEIDKHLGEIKAKHGFTKLSAQLAGKVWRVSADMNPSTSESGKTIEVKADPSATGDARKDGAAEEKDGGSTDKPPLAEAEVLKVGGERITKLFTSWNKDVHDAKLKDKDASGKEIEIWGASYGQVDANGKARSSALEALKEDSKRAGAPRNATALAGELANKESALKSKFQTSAGVEVAKDVAAHGAKRASADLKQKIEHEVKYEHNLHYGRIALPGPEQTAHTLYKPTDIKSVTTPEGRTLTFKYEPPHDKMQFTCKLDNNELPREVTAENLTFKTQDLRGKMGESPAHQPNAGMHNAHIVADMISGSGYKQTCNLISTSAHYNLHEMSSAEREIAAFLKGEVEDHDAVFNLRVKIQWEKLDSDAAIQRILAKNDLWKGESESAVRDALKKFLKGFGSKLHRVMDLQYNVEVTLPNGKVVRADPIVRGADIYLGV